jgi:hypothetical protein
LESQPLKSRKHIRKTRINLEEVDNVVCKLHLYKPREAISC